jgi:hypothetical protein
MAIRLIQKALTTLEAVKSELGLTVTTHDDYLSRQINVISDAIETYCNQSFYYRSITNEKHTSSGGKYLFLDVPNIISISDISYEDITIDSTLYEIYNALTSMVVYINGYWIYDPETTGITDYALPRTEIKGYSVDYTAGYVLPKDSIVGTVTGGNTETFDFSGGKTLDISTSEGSTAVTFVDGDFAGPTVATALEVKAVIDLAIGDDLTCSIVSGAISLATTGDDSSNYVQVTGGTAQTILDLDSDKHSGTRTLPWGLENICIQTVSGLYNSRGLDKNIKSEKLLSYSVTYGNTGGSGSYGDSLFPSSVMKALNKYKRF